MDAINLQQAVCEANLELVRRGLVFLTWGNASAIDRERGRVVIKPSGVPYGTMTPEQMVTVDLDGCVIDGSLSPSVDLPTHLALYAAFPAVGGIVHTHSHYATCWAQAARPIPCFGTTHADHFHGDVPVTEPLTRQEVEHGYERNIGLAIVRRFERLDPLAFPGVLCAGHASFAWGRTLDDAVDNALALEEIARMALDTLLLNPATGPIAPFLLDKHFLRKHGRSAYYGQK